MPSIDRPHYQHSALSEFAPRAKAFCELVERYADFSMQNFLQETHRALAGLYVSALSLPDFEVLFDISNDEANDDEGKPINRTPDPDRRTHEEWRVMFRELGVFLGPHNSYREVFDPYEPPEEKEVVGSLADDISDIYGDLRLGLRHWERGETGEALWEWRFNFESHWSEHLTGALRALNALASNHELEWPSAAPGTT